MSLESIRARVEAVSSSVRETGVIDFEADVAVELCATDIPLLLKVAEAAPTIDHINQLIEFMDSGDRLMEAIGDPGNADINVGALAVKIGAVGYKAAEEHQVQDALLKFRDALVELNSNERKS